MLPCMCFSVHGEILITDPQGTRKKLVTLPTQQLIPVSKLSAENFAGVVIGVETIIANSAPADRVVVQLYNATASS